jgi:hypothetical protein
MTFQLSLPLKYNQMKTKYYKLLLLSAFFLLMQFSYAQQRVVTIQGIIPGQPLVYDQIFNAINADAPNRVTNKNVVYELKRGQVYLNTSTINSTDFDLYIRAEAGTGILPIIFHTLNSAGNSAVMITARQNLILENIEIDGKHSNGTLGNRILNMYGKNYRCTFRGCRITNDRGGALAVQVDGVKLYYIDCIIGNMGHQISLGGNGRAVDLRNTGTVDTVVIQNCTMYNMTDRVFRNMAPVINYFKMDHNTIINIQGYHGCIQLGKTKKAIITNNIFANPLTHGDRFTARWRTEQMQPDKAFAVITHDSLSSKLTSAAVEMRNNNIYHEKKFVDFFNLTLPNDSIGDVRPINNAIIKFVGTGLPQAYFAEELAFKNTSSSLMLYNYLTYWVTHPKASVFPNNFSEIYPYEWDVSYSTTSRSYKAGDNGYPVGDLNAWPALKTQWMQGIVQKSAPLKSLTIEDIKIDTSFPNPFIGQTTINYSLSQSQKILATVYNPAGQLCKILVNGELAAGNYSVIWDGKNNSGSDLPKGIYLLQIAGSKNRVVRKLIKN